jgi:hypothetical protein
MDNLHGELYRKPAKLWNRRIESMLGSIYGIRQMAPALRANLIYNRIWFRRYWA